MCFCMFVYVFYYDAGKTCECPYRKIYSIKVVNTEDRRAEITHTEISLLWSPPYWNIYIQFDKRILQQLPKIKLHKK